MIPQSFFDAAKRIVELERGLYPGCDEVVGKLSSSIGGSNTSLSSSGARYGTTSNEQRSVQDGDMVSLLRGQGAISGADAVNKNLYKAFLSTMLGKTDSQAPGYSELTSFLATSPTTFPGASSLTTTANRDPYSGSYELETQDAYKQRAGDAMAMAATGPEAVRGGAARTGIAQASLADMLARGRGQEVRTAQNQEVQNTQGAAGLYSGISNAIRQQVLNSSLGLAQAVGQQQDRQLSSAKTASTGQLTDMNILQSIASILGISQNRTTENIGTTSEGQSDGETWSFGL